MFNHGGGFFTPKNFQFPQHFTPKTLIGHSTTTNESCSLMLDSDVRSVTYALKSSKESTLRQETNSTQRENKNIRMIEYEEFEKSNSSQIQYSQEQNTHHNNLIVDINTGRSGKLIAEGTLSHADSEERNQITPQSQQILQFDFKLKQQQQSVSSSQQLLDSQNFTENQRNNLQSNDFWIQNVKLDTELQFLNRNLQKIDLREHIQNIQDEDKMLGIRNEDFSNDCILFQNIQQGSNVDNIEQINLTQEKPKKRIQKIDLQQQQQEQAIKVTQNGKEKSKIYVQDNNFQESIIYEEEDSENSKSTDRQYYKLNRSISNQILSQINSIPRCQSTARNESQQKNCSNKNLHNTSKNSHASFNQSVQAFNIEEENSGSKQLLSQQNQAKSQENIQQIQDSNLHNLSEQLTYHVDQQSMEQKNSNSIKFFTQNSQQNQNQEIKQSHQQPKEQLKNSCFQVNKQHLSINNIDTNFQNEDFTQKPFSSFQQNNEAIYEFFGAGKKDSLKDCQDVYQYQENTNANDILLQEYKIQNENIGSDLVPTAQKNLQQNQSELDEEYKNEGGSDQLFYPNSSKCNSSSLDEGYNYQQDTENKENLNNGPIQKLNFDQCQSSEGSQSSRDDLNNDSIALKQNFQNLITNYKKRNSSFPQLSNSHNTSRNSNYNSSSNPQIEVTPSINNMRGTSVSNQNQINTYKILQDNLEEQDSQQKPFKSGQCSVILKKLEETLDMNSESDFYLIKKLQLSHGVSQLHSEIDTSQNQIQIQINQQQYKKINPITNQTYILEETGEDFIFNSKEIERLEQIDNSFFANNKENMGGQNSSINFDSKILLADTIYNSCNKSHLYFINQSSEKRGFKSHQKERKSHFINIHENSQNQQIQSGISQLNKIKKNQQHENQYQVLSKPKQQQSIKAYQDEQKSQSCQLNQSQQNGISQVQMQNKNSQTTNENCNQEINYIKEIEYLKKEVIKLNKDLKNIDIQNYKYQEIIDQQQANILRLEEKLIYYKDEVKSKQQQIEKKDMQINKLFEEKEELKQKKKKLKDQIKAKNQEIYQQQRVNYTAKNEAIHKLQQKIDQKNDILYERNEQFQAIQQQITDTSSQLEAKQQEINYLISENQQLKEQMKFYSQDSASNYLQTSNKSFTNLTGQINQNCIRSGKIANSEYNNKQIVSNESNQQQNYIATSTSSSSTQHFQSGNNAKDQKFSNITQKQNDKRIRSFSYNDTCNNQNSSQFYGQKVALNLDQMISSQPYNLTEEQQQLTKSTQQDIINSQEIYNHQRFSLQGNQIIGADQNLNRFQNNQQGNQDKLNHQQVRYSYDNYKNYQQNQQKHYNLPQPMTLNSAIAQYKIQALEERKYTETNNNNSNNNILVNQQYNILEQPFKQSKNQKQIENNTNSVSSVSFNCNESINQLGNRSQISTSCNSRHYESHASNSQVPSNNNSQKSLISVNQKNQQTQFQQQQQKQQVYQQNNCYEKNDIQHQNNTRSRTNDYNSKNPQYTSFNEVGRNSSSQTIKEIYTQNSRPQNNYSEKENLSNKFENTQQNNLNKIYPTKLQEKNVFNLQNNNSLNSFNQNQIKFNFQVGERVSTSPSRNYKNNQMMNDELNEYNSVPSYTNNELAKENKQFLREQIFQNQINGRKQSNIDVASINNKINSNNQLIQNLNLNKNKQSSSQGSAHSIIQSNQVNINQNFQQKIKREHSYSLNQQLANINNIDQNNLQNPQLSSSLIDQNKFKKPPRSTNEMRQSLQGSSQQQILISTQHINIDNHNENLNFGSIENRNSQKQVAFEIQNNQINEFSKQNNNEQSVQHSIQLKQYQQQQQQYYQQQQQQLQSSQRFEKFQKWNNQINSLI
ncbi:hypothetical protein ABPG72_012456 [Tetrahymena utriculariae]